MHVSSTPALKNIASTHRPVITILKYDDLNEAIQVANNTEFDLGGIVFGSKSFKAQEMAEAMNTSSVGITFYASNHAAPFGGRHDSSLGVEYGLEGRTVYLAYKRIINASVSAVE